jgi:hypothetical protein
MARDAALRMETHLAHPDSVLTGAQAAHRIAVVCPARCAGAAGWRQDAAGHCAQEKLSWR